jgi:hypothetical protein
VLVRSGKGKDHVGAYYFQTRPDPTVTYIASLSGARWENWRHDWVIARIEVSDRLALPSDGPRLDRKQWRERPCLVPEFEPILDRIKELAVGGLTSMHVLGNFLKRRVMPLQGRLRLCCWFTGSNDIGRILRGPRTDLTWEELEIFVRGITGEAFIPESLMPPRAFHLSMTTQRCGQRCWLDYRPLMRVVWRSARPAAGTPTRGSTFLVYQPEARSLLMWPPGPLLWALVLWTRARSLHAALLLQTPPGGRGKKGDLDCVAPMGPLSRTHPLIWAPPRSVRKQLVGLRRPNFRPRTGRGA